MQAHEVKAYIAGESAFIAGMIREAERMERAERRFLKLQAKRKR